MVFVCTINTYNWVWKDSLHLLWLDKWNLDILFLQIGSAFLLCNIYGHRSHEIINIRCIFRIAMHIIICVNIYRAWLDGTSVDSCCAPNRVIGWSDHLLLQCRCHIYSWGLKRWKKEIKRELVIENWKLSRLIGFTGHLFLCCYIHGDKKCIMIKWVGWSDHLLLCCRCHIYSWGLKRLKKEIKES